jgi:hypothetical protein
MKRVKMFWLGGWRLIRLIVKAIVTDRNPAFKYICSLCGLEGARSGSQRYLKLSILRGFYEFKIS